MGDNAVYMSDFVTGLLAGLALLDVRSLSVRESRLDRAFAETFQDLEEEARESKLTLKFRVRTHPVHGDSPAVLQALYDAAKRELVSLDNPEFVDLRLKITAAEAPAYLNRLPGTSDLYTRLARRFLEHYRTGEGASTRMPAAKAIEGAAAKL